MDYFTELPAILYPNLEENDSTRFVALTNILTRSAFLQEIVDNTALFYEYDVRDGETPEIIADKLYGSPKRFWIVLLFNQLNNPYYDFPLTSEQLNSLIESRYGYDAETAQSTIHHYELRVKRSVLLNGIVQSSNTTVYTISEQMPDPTTGIAIDRGTLPGTADTMVEGDTNTESFGSGVTVSTTRSYWAISTYTYEYEENEKRRKIRLLDKDYVGPVENEFRRLMRVN